LQDGSDGAPSNVQNQERRYEEAVTTAELEAALSLFAVTAVAATANMTTMATVHRVTPQQDFSDVEFMMPQEGNCDPAKQAPTQRAFLKEVLTARQWQI